MKFFLFALLFLAPSLDYGQTAIFKATISAIDDDELLEGIQVKDLQTGHFTYTNKDGYFELNTSNMHQLEISGSMISKQVLVVQTRMFGKVQNLYVKILSTALNAVSVEAPSPYKVDSTLRYELYQADLERKKDKLEYNPLENPFVLKKPISSWLQYLAPKTKARFKFQKNFATWEKQKFIETKYPPEQVSRLTGLTGDSLAWFMNAFPMSFDFAISATKLSVESWVLANYLDWRSNPKKYIDAIRIQIEPDISK